MMSWARCRARACGSVGSRIAVPSRAVRILYWGGGGGAFGSWSLASRFSSRASRPVWRNACCASSRSSFGLSAGPASSRVCAASALSIPESARFSHWKSTLSVIASSRHTSTGRRRSVQIASTACTRCCAVNGSGSFFTRTWGDMGASFQVVADLLAGPRLLAVDEHLHAALLRPDHHRLLAHPPHHVEGALRGPAERELQDVLLDAALDHLPELLR